METKFNLLDLDKYLRKWLNKPHIVELMQDCVHESVEENQPPKAVDGKVDINEYARSVVLNELIRINMNLTANIVALYNAADSLAEQFADDYLTDTQQVDLFSLDAGQHFLYNDIEFVKLGDEQAGILCITADIWKKLPFDKAEHNNFANSSLLDVLNSSFLSRLGDKDLLLYEVDLTADNGDRSYGSTLMLVGLLSTTLYRKYRDHIPQYTDSVMTCTPSYCGDVVDYIRCIGPGGVFADYYTGVDLGVVPAVIFLKNTVVRLKKLKK